MGKARNIADLLNSSGKIDSADIDSSAQFYQFKNRIINGDCRIDQRNAGASISNTGVKIYSLDRWFIQGSSATKFTAQQNAGSVTPPTGFTNYLGITSSAATSVGSSDYYFTGQSIEGFNTADLGWGTANAASVTLSFWVRSSLTGTFGGSLRNSAGNRSYPFSYTISAANTWEQKSITIAGDTTGTWVGATNGIGIDLSFNLGAGSTFSGTAGAWAAGNFISTTGATSVVGTNGATFYITGVQLEKGSTATSFDYRPYGTELALCQRYFCMSFSQGVVPTNGLDKAFVRNIVPYSSANGYTDTIEFPVQMRTIPSVTPYSSNTGSGSTWQYYNGTAWVNTTSTTAYNISTNGFYFEPVGTFTQWSPRLCQGHYTASAEL